jgi:hypothetical protein
MSKPSEGAHKRAADTSAKYVPLIIKGVEGDAAGLIMIAEMLMLEALNRLHANAQRRAEILAHFTVCAQRHADDPEWKR